MLTQITSPDVYFDRPQERDIRVTVYDHHQARHSPDAVFYFTPADFVRLSTAMHEYARTLKVVAVRSTDYEVR